VDSADSSNPTAAGLPSQYVPGAVEARLYEAWVERGYFTADADSDKPPFCIVIPPPNVTGSLHLGHAYEHTLIDALTRRRRMQGYEALWLPGMDHASIAVHALVERELIAEGTSRRELGRDAFVARTWEWKAEHGGKILAQMRRLGDGVDWSRERFTMDAGLSRAVQFIFKRLFDEKLIYRAERLVNWSPTLRSGLSDIEVEHKDVEGELVTLRYGDLDGETIDVATTRVETMLGDTAVAVHPDDDRYRHLVGREVLLPLTGRRIPVIADEHVNAEFGTGAVKVTPAHDPNDFEIGRRHNLPMLNILDEDARITGTDTPFDGLDRFEARVAVREALREQGRIVAEKRPYLHSVGHSSRSKEPIEPRLSLQWFVAVESLAKAAGAAVRDGRVRINPAEMEPRYFGWVDDMHDWCISRQLWWGHRIPVWYGKNGEVVCVGPDEQPPSGDGWSQDPDVLDTWFSSALWPFSTLGWPEQTKDLARFYPNSLLVTGYDILFFWVVRMMMFGLYAMDGVQPFDVIALHGMVRDTHGKKMSKSAGNVVDPLAWIDDYGADALRFTIARGANPGADMPIGEEWVQGSRNFCNKLWNAARFAMLNGATIEGPLPSPDSLATTDRWILSRLRTVLVDVDSCYEAFEFAKASDTIFHFVWDEFCDWYVELAKVSLATAGTEADATRRVLGHVLDVVLRLLHPIAPFVTEELWTALTGEPSLVIASWPAGTVQAPDPMLSPQYLDADTESTLAELQAIVTEVRRFRAEQGLRPAQRVPAVIEGLAATPLVAFEEQIRTLARLQPASDSFVETAGVVVGNGDRTIRVGLDMSGTIDIGKERARLTKALDVAINEVALAEAKLANPEFTRKAPVAVIDKMQARLDGARADVVRLRSQLDALPPS
jgi:valyl-tRNA synthetase